jgi:hypothetical protein
MDEATPARRLLKVAMTRADALRPTGTPPCDVCGEKSVATLMHDDAPRHSTRMRAWASA